MYLVIAEKPSVAQSIAAILGAKQRREGELIFRNVYVLSGTNKPMKRLWISSMEDDAIREGFRQLRAGSDYDALHHRQCAR